LAEVLSNTCPLDVSHASGIAAKAQAKPTTALASKHSRAPNAWLISLFFHLVFLSGVCLVAPEVAGLRPLRDEPVHVVHVLTVPQVRLPELEPAPALVLTDAPALLMQAEDAEDPVTEDLQLQEPANDVASDDTGDVDSYDVTVNWEKLRPQPQPVAPQLPIKIDAGGGNAAGTGLGGGGTGAGVGGDSGYSAGYGSGTGSGTGRGGGAGTGTGTGIGNGSAAGRQPAKGKSRSARPKASITPVYPESERKAGRSATVLLEILVDEKGRATEVRVIGGASEPQAFVNSAVSAARNARYEPALEDGVLVPCYIKVNITYKLK